RVALRAAVSLAVPLLFLWAIDRVDLSVYASFGAFASLYGRYDAYADRIRMQAAAGAVVVAAMLIGTTLVLLDTPVALRTVIVSLLAALAALAAYRWRWHPPGALFVVFAAGACASIPAEPASLMHVVLLGGGSVLFSVAVTSGIAVVRRGLRRTPQRNTLAADADARWMAVAVGSGALLAGLAALVLIGDHWYWAMVGAVAALGGAQLTARIVRGLQRLVGTLIGVAIAAGLLALQLPPLATIAVAVLLQAGAELYVNRNYGVAMFFVTPLALLMVELAVPADPLVLLRDRALDTAIGVAVGTSVAVVAAWNRRRGTRVRDSPPAGGHDVGPTP
ncbi:MAG: FUSC family protein, partial [Microbacterium sp.]